MNKYRFLGVVLSLFFIALPGNDFLLPKKYLNSVSMAAQEGIRIKQRSPVVNEGNRIKLSVVDGDGNPITEGVIWQSGSPDIASVNLSTGEILGVKSGFATITATQNGISSSVFLTVSKVRKSSGSLVPGDTKTDISGSVYISNPTQNIILKAENTPNAKVFTFAGKSRVAGHRNGLLKEALFAGPTAIGVDNTTNGGLYIADTLNHNIRKIGFNDKVETILGKNSPGTSTFTSDGKLDLEKLLLNSPRGVVIDGGGNVFVADTDNHAIYYVDIAKRRVNIVAGEPGQSGKEDGTGRTARFKRPSGMALSTDGRLLTVADEDNNRVRLIEISRGSSEEVLGDVSTLGVASSSAGLVLKDRTLNRATDEIVFNKPQSVSLDGLGNIYVVDSKAVQLVLRRPNQMPEVIELAEPNVTFGKPVSVTVKGTEAFVLDTASSATEALKIVSVGGPEILQVEPDIINVGQTTDLIISGKNFSPDTQIVFGGQSIPFTSIKAEEIRVQLPKQNLPGRITLSILTRGGLAQKEINSLSKSVNLLAPGEITTIAGGAIFLGNGGAAGFANLGSPIKSVVDSFGNLFISDRGTRTVRRVDKQTGLITTAAGGGESLSDNVLANTALIRPSSIAISKSGDLFIVDSAVVIKKVNMLTGIITTVAGNIGKGFGGDGGPAIDAGFSGISDIAIDKKGNLLVLESNNLRQIDEKGIIRTIAGTGRSLFNGDGGPATSASFMFGFSLAVDSKGNIFICDFLNNRVRQVNKKGIISTVAGNGEKQPTMSPQERDGKKATSVSLYSPTNIAVDLKGNLFIQDQGSLNSPTSTISNVSLKGKLINTQKINGKEPDGQVVKPKDAKLTTDGLGNLLFTSTAFNVFQLNVKSGEAVKVAGNTKFNFFGDQGLATFAALGDISDITTDLSGNIYLSDFINGRVRQINSSTGVIDSLVGKDGAQTLTGNEVAAAEKVAILPVALALRGNNLLITEFVNNTWFIRELNLSAGTITTIAGSNAGTFSDGRPALETNFNSIGSIATNSQGDIFLLDGNRLRQIDAKTSIVTTLASLNFAGLAANDLVIDKNGDIFISFLGNLNGSASMGGAVLLFEVKTGKTTVFAGGNGVLFEGDKGLATNASLGYVESISLDTDGNLFIGAYTPLITGQGLFKKIPRIWKVDRQTKTINTFISTKDGLYSGDGGSFASASLADCSNIFIDGKNLFIVNKDSAVQSVRLAKLGN